MNSNAWRWVGVYLLVGALYTFLGYPQIIFHHKLLFLFAGDFWLTVLFWPVFIILNWLKTILLALIILGVGVWALSRMFPKIGMFFAYLGRGFLRHFGLA